MLGIDHAITDRAMDPRGIFLPHRRRIVAQRDRDAGQQPPQHAVADDAVRGGGAFGGDGVIGGRRQRQQYAALAELRIDRDHPFRRDHQPRRRGAKQSAHFAKAFGAGNEHALTRTESARRSGFDHLADQLVAGNQGVSHSRKWRHPAGPQQPFGPSANSAPIDVNHNVVGGRCSQGKPVELNLLRLLQDYRDGFHR